jgi:hypothetical protein
MNATASMLAAPTTQLPLVNSHQECAEMLLLLPLQRLITVEA